MLGYRSLFTVEPQADLTSVVLAQIHSWLRSKQYEADRLEANGDVALISPHVEAVLTTEHLQDESRSSLFVMREETDPRGAWITQIIVHVPGHGRARPWVWIDVEQEGVDDVWAGRPRVARELLQVLQGDDHGALLNATAPVLETDDVDYLVDVLTSEERRGPVFVAGSSEILPLGEWSAYVEGLLRETVGLSAGFVLDHEATVQFAKRVGERHAVMPGTLRTYLPGLDPESELDSFRHRFLTADAIIKTPPGRIRKTLGRRARDLAITRPLPQWAIRVESRLLSATDRRVLGWRPTILVESEPPLVEPTARVERELTRTPETTAPTPGTSELTAVSRQLFGRDLDEELLRWLAAELDVATTLNRQLAQADSRAASLNARLLELQHERDLLRAESEDAQVEWAMAEETAAEHERTIIALRRSLMEAGQHDAAWQDVPEPSPAEVAPESFADLLVRFDELPYVVFTGDDDYCDVLDEKMPIAPSAKAWSALLALNDYARAKERGEAEGTVHQYLLHGPSGYASFSANRHAQNESEDVHNNPKYFEARVLPVPKHVDENGSVFMGAHFKIAKFGAISPRLHYYDATGTDGKIYVGYIGPHLPTQKTN